MSDWRLRVAWPPAWLRSPLRWYALLIVLLALAGHIYWWYWPRVHPALPPPDSVLTGWLAARGAEAEAWPMAAWLPYPHQNLAVLRQRAGLEPRALLAAGRLAGLPEPHLPPFGGLPLPPASAMALVSDQEGRRFALAAEVYPIFAWFSHLAGVLAGNPFLGGGEMVVDGRRLEVTWHGNLWTVSSPDALPEALLAPPEPGLPDFAAGDAAAPALLFLRIDRDLEVAPAGLYALRFEPEAFTFELRSVAAVPPWLAFRGVDLASRRAYLLAFAGAAQGEETARQALAFFPHDDPSSQDLPRVAVFAEQGRRRWELPAEGLLEFTGRKVLQTEAGNWQISTFEQKSLQGSERLLPMIEELAGREEIRQLRFGLWLDLDPATLEVQRIGRMIDRAPWLSRRKVARWHDIETVLVAFSTRFRMLSLVVADDPAALQLRLEGRPAAALAEQ